MKKIFLSVFSLLLVATVFSQYCGGSGSAVCSPGGPYSQLGFYPPYDSTPCAIIGVPYDQKIDMQIPPSTIFQGQNANINWVRVDSVENLPCGLCWRTNSSNNQFNGNSAGCVRITGTTLDAPGQYKMRIRVTVNATVGIFPITLSNQDAEQFGIRYWARVKATSGSACLDIDTLAAGNQKSSPGAIATPTISGNTALCSGASGTYTVSGVYDAYVWSNGTVGNSITTSTAGTYTVSVYDNCASATASVSVTSANATPTITANGPTTFCQGGSVTLDAGAGFTTYAWSNGATSQTINVTTANTYAVTVTKNGCTGTDSKVVTVTSNNLNPTITPVGPINICPGGSVTLDAGSGYDTYTWNDNSSSQTLTANSQGAYSVTVTQGACSGTASRTVNVGNFPLTVNVSPAGPVSLCSGENVTLDAGAGFSGYNWSNSDQSQTTTVNTGGSYIVVVSQAGCVGRDTVDVVVHNNPVPVLSPNVDQEICAGSTVTFATQGGFSSYLWSNGSNTASIVVSNSNTYSVTVTDANQCTGASNGGVLVTVNPNPVATIAVSQVGSSSNYLLDAAPSSATSYVWQQAVNNDTTTGQVVNLSGNNDDTLQVNCATQGGYWRVAVTDGNGCKDTSNFAKVDICLGVGNVAGEVQFQMMPNPANSIVYINYTLLESAEVHVSLVDISGRVIKELLNETQSSGTQFLKADLANVSQGVYYVDFNAAGNRFAKKLIVE